MLRDDVAKVLLDETTIQERVAQLGRQIANDYQRQDLLLLCLLKGGVVFLSDLMRHIDIPHEVEFMAISSYGAATETSGVVRILMDLKANILDRHVLIVEDIVDSGRTLDYILRNLGTRGPASLNRMRREILDAFNQELWPDQKPKIRKVLFKEFAVK